MEPSLLLILSIVVGIQAGPIDTITRDTDSCARTCTATNKFNYEQDKTYEFEYKAKTTTSMVGASEGKADLEVTATAQIEVISKCELVLRVQNANLFETDPETGSSREAEQSRMFQRALEALPLRFSFQDGEIEELCPARGEQTWVLNIKRGILSMLQNTMDDFSRDQRVKESDVAGNCDAEYITGESGWYSLSVKKSKNLLGCTGRHGYNTAVQGTPYKVPSKIQSLPIVKSNHECKQEITKEGRIKDAVCTESYIFRPFSRESSGAVTESKQNIKFLRERNGVSTPPMVTNRAKLLFEHVYDANTMTRSRKDLESKLRGICQSTREGVRPETPKFFSDLIYLMKAMDADSLRQVYQQIKSSQLCSDNNKRVQKYFLDAIPMVGTSFSLRLLTELITSNEVTGIEADMWMTSLAFIQNPSKDMLKEVLPLVSEMKGMLSVGTLVHSYCRIASCENDNDIRTIITELESKIGYGCYVDDTNMKKITVALRAIGNAGQAERATATISSCMTRKENPTEVRLAAIDAFRRISCEADRGSILAIFNDKEEDSELRIGAYIALMECPTSSFLSRVKTTLLMEEANQVGSFIWTHLTNLMESSSRHKQNIRGILEDEVLQREFNMDKRKFSRNYEGSFFLEKLNTGASLEGNLIWSSKSFIPRSAMANLTVDLFGHSINLFEIGGRIEGLEYFLEAYFGPNGYFSEDNVKKPTEQSVKGISTNKFKTIDNRFTSTMDELKGNLYLRVFGNELRYNSFNGVKDLTSGNDFNFLDLLIKLSENNDYSFTQNIMFLDSTMIIPTSTGFPLNLTVNGTATIDLKASGKMDLRKLGTSPRSVSINGILQPSGSVLISSMMSVDAFVTKIGMKMVSTLHSSTTLQGNIELAKGRVFSAQIDMPREKMEIINFKTSFFTVHRDTEREQKMITENRQTKRACSGSGLAKITGLEFCGEVQFPNASLKPESPYFPLTGPVTLALNLYKRDTHSGYKMESKLFNTKDEAVMRLAFDTPGSTMERAMAVDFTLKKKDKTLEMNMISPWKKATFTGKTQYDRNVKHLSGKLDVDGKTVYSLKSEIKKTRKGPSYVYTPTLEIRIPKTKVIQFGGSVEYQSGKLLDSTLTLAGVTKHPIKSTLTFTNKKILQAIKGSISFAKGKVYSFQNRLQTYITKKAIKYRPFVSIKTPKKELIALGGSVEYRGGASATVDLTLDKIVDNPVKVFVKVRKTGKANSPRYHGKVDIRSPILTTKMKTSIVIRGKKAMNVRTQMDYNIPRVIRDRVILNGKISMTQTKTTTSLKGSTNMEFKRRPQYNFQIAGSMSHNRKHSEGNIAVQYGADKKDKTKLFLISTSITPQLAWKCSNLQFDTKLQHPATDINIHAKLEHRHDRKSLDSSMLLEYGKKKSISSSLRLKNKSKSLASLFGSFEMALPGRELSISNDLSENSKNDFTNEFTAQLSRGEKSTVVSNFRQQSPTEYEVSTDVTLYNKEPFRMAGQFNIDPKNLRAQIEKGTERYLLTSSIQYTEDSNLVFNSELQYPTRRMIVGIDASKKYPVLTGNIDIKWNADRDETERMQLYTKVSYKGINNIDTSVSLKYPTNVITFNLKHTGGKKYVSHVYLKWDSSKIMTLDTAFSTKGDANAKQLRGAITISTPFRDFRSIAIDSMTRADLSKYTTSLNINWKPIKKISTIVTIKKPINWNSFDASVVVKSPLKGFQRSSLEISHAVGKKMASKAKLNWNKNLFQLSLEGADKSSSRSTDVSGRVSVRSTIKGIKSITLVFGHKCSGKKFQNNLKLINDNNAFSYKGEMTHALRGWRLQNNGRILLTSPTTRYESSWTHRNTEENIVSNLNAKWGENSLQINLNGVQDLSWPRGTLSSALQIKSPFELIRNVGMDIKHEHRIGLINSELSFNNEGNKVFSLESNYNRENDQAKTSHVLRTSEKEMSLKSTTQYVTYPLTSKINLQWSPEEKIEICGSIDKDYTGLFNGNLNFASPFTDDKQLSFNQNRNSGDLVTSASISYKPGQSVSMENRFRWDNTKKVHLTINTPYSPFRRLQSEIEFIGNIQTFHSMGSFELQPSLRKVSFNSQWSSVGGVLGNVKVETPFTQLPYAQVNIDSKLKAENRKTSLMIEFSPRKIISIETTGRIKPKDIEGILTISTPFSEVPRITAVFRQKGGFQNFNTHVNYECSFTGKYEVNMNFQNNETKEGSIIVKIPSREDITARFSHFGHLESFQSHGEFGYESGRIYEADIRFVNTGKTEGSLILKSPLMDDIIGTFRHSGNLNDFQTHGNFEYISGKKYELDLHLNTNRKLDGSVTMKAQGFDAVNAAFSHRGRISNFQSHAELTYRKGETYEGDFVFNADRNVNTKVTILTPIKGYKKLKASFVHKGSWKSFTCRANMANGRRNMEGNIKFTIKPVITATASLQTPFYGYKTLRVSISHDGPLRNFKSHGEVSSDKNNRIVGDVEFSLEPSVKFVASLLTPFKGLESVRTTITHEVTPQSITSYAELSYARYNPLVVNVKLDSSSGITAEVTVLTQFVGYEKLSGTINHSGSIDNFASSAEFANGDNKKISGDVRFSMRGPVTGEATLTTPFEGLELNRVAFSHDGTMNNFRSHGEIAYRNKMTEGDITFSTLDNVEGSLIIKSPYFEQVKGSFSSQGSLLNLRTKANLVYGRESIVDGIVTLTTAPTIRGSLSLQAIRAPRIQITFAHEGPKLNFHTQGEIVVGRRRIELDTTLNAININDMSGNIVLKTPFFGDIRAALSHTGRQVGFRSHLEGGINGQKVESDVTFSSRSGLSGTVSIKTPLSKYKEIEASFSHSGHLKNFQCQAEFICNGKKTEVDSSFSSTGPITGRATLKTPIYRDIILQFNHDGSLNDFISHGEITYSGARQITGDMSFHTNPSLDFAADIKTPFKMFDMLQLALKHEGSLRNFRSEIGYMRNAEKSSLDITFDSSGDVVANVTLNLPNTNQIVLGLTHSGVLNNFHSHAELIFLGTKQYELDAAINAVDYNSVDGNIDVKTQIRGFESLSTTFCHKDDTQRMATSYAMEGVTSKKIEIAMNYEKGQKKEASITVTSPFLRDIRVTSSHEGSLPNIHSSIDIFYDTQEKFHGEVEIIIGRRTTSSVSARVAGQTLNALFNHEGSLRNFRSEIGYMLNAEKSSLDVTFDSISDVVAKATLNLPNTNEIVLGLAHSGILNNFHSHAELFFFGAKQYELDAAINAVDYKSVDGNIDVKTTIRGFESLSAIFSHKDDTQRMATSYAMEGLTSKKIEIAMNYEKGQKKEASITVTSPFLRDIRVTSSHEGSLPNIHSSIDIFYDTQEKFHGEVEIITGRRTTSSSVLARVAGQTLNALFNHEGELHNFKSHAEISLNGEKMESDVTLKNTDKTAASLTFRSPIKCMENLGASFSHQATQRNTKSQVEFNYLRENIVGDFSLVKGTNTEATLQIQTPYNNFENTKGSIVYTPTNKGQAMHVETIIYGQKYECEILLNTVGPLEASFALKTPFNGYENTKVAFSYQMEDGSVQTHAEIVYGYQQKSEVDFSLQFRDQVGATFNLRTPFTGFEEITTSLQHQKSRSGFRTHAQVTLNALGTFETDVFFRSRGKIEGKISLKTPFRNYEEMSASFEHNFASRNLKSHGEINYGQQNKLELDISYNKDVDGSIVLKTPFSRFEETSLSVRRDGYSHQLEIIYDQGKRIEMEIYMRIEPEFESRMVVNTPFAGFERTIASLRHRMTSENIESHAEVVYGQEKIEGDIELSKAPLRGKLLLKTPVDGFEETIFLFHHDKTPTGFRSHTELVYGLQKKIEGDISFENSRQLLGQVVLKTPVSGFEETSAIFQHTVSSRDVKSHAELNYGNRQKIETDLLLSSQDRTEGSVSLKTPFSGYRKIIALLRHAPTPGSIVSHAEFLLEEQKLEFDLEFENRLDSFGIMSSMKSPWLNDIGVSFNKNGPLDNLVVKGETTLGSKKPVEMMLKNVKIGSKIESSLTIRNPFTEEISVKFDHNGGWRRFRSTAEASLGSQNRLKSETSFRSRTGFVNFGSTLVTVLEGSSRLTEINLKHNGDITNFKSTASVTYEGQKIDLKTQFKNAGTVEGTFTLKTPFRMMTNIGAGFQHSGSINQFSSSGNLQYAPGKQLEGKVEFFKYGWRKISTSIELKTPFSDYRFTKLTYKHKGDSDSVQCNGDITYGAGKQLIGSLKASKSPLQFAIAARTPFTGYEDVSVGAKFEEQGNRYTAGGNLVYATGKSIEVKSVVDMQANPNSVNARITTPFSGFESTDITLTYYGNIRNFRSTGEFQASYVSPFKADVSLQYDSLSELEGLATFTSQFDNFENLKFSLRNRKTDDEYNTHIESSWSTSDAVVADTVFALTETWNGNNIVYGVSCSTPFENLRTANIKGNIELTDKYSEQISIEHNGETMLDMDMGYTKNNKHSAIINIREPRSMLFSTNGLYTEAQISGEITVNWNTKKSDSFIKLEGNINDNNDYHTNRKDIVIKASSSRESFGISGVLEKSTSRTLSSADLSINEERKIGYELETTSSNRMGQKGSSFKLRLPKRTIALTGFYGSTAAEAAILWDAERDETKKIGVKGNIVPQRDSVNVDVSFSMPSIGKDVQFDSEMTLNNGRILFDGKTEFRYSDDTRKTLVLHSKIQDTSAGYSKNYSLCFGISHPYTSVDIQMKSHVGQSDEKYTAGMDVLYLTAQRQRKNFALMGEIDNFRNEMNVQLISPAKSLRLQGNVKTQSPYKISIRNHYDNRPMNTMATFIPERRYFDFSVNYDIDNPGKAFHISARYVNDSAVVAEMYREENSQRLTDSVFAVRLNTSKMLHTRLHWKPSMLQELKEFGLGRIHHYGTKVDSALSEAGEAVSEDLNYKYNLIRQAASEDFQPFANFVTETMTQLGSEIQVARQELDRMYRSNEYYTQDVYVYYDRVLRDIQSRYNIKMEQVRQWSESIKSAASSWTYFPLKDTYDHYLLKLREILQEGERTSSLLYRQLLESVEAKLIHLSKSLEESYTHYKNRLNESVSIVSNHPSVKIVKDKYSQYLNKLRSFTIPEQVQNVAEQYSGAIYNVREIMNTGLASLMTRGDIRYVKSMADEAYFQGSAAYKYWEIEENVKEVLKQIYEYIREEIEEEITGIKDTIFNLKRTRVTVYDLENGEIQTDVYLPISLTSLDTLPKINVVKYVNRVKSYIPHTSRLSSINEYFPDSDLYSMIPPFKGDASVIGDHVTTFDGEEFDISGRCSYILSRDYRNGNYTIMLDYLGRQKRKLVVFTATQNIQVSPTGKVKVDSRLIKLPYKSSEVHIEQEGDIIKVNGRGFSISNNIPRDSYYVSVSGWYFGKLGGLLGTLNNERYDDMMMSNKKTTDDINAFTDSWEVDSKCR